MTTDHVRVRMYRQGLGDCFLLTFPRTAGESHVLIDCGVLKGTEDVKDRMRRVAESIEKTTGGRIDALVLTHEHWDHVSGFLQAEEVFNRLEVKEVWLAWTEDPSDDTARELARKRRKVAEAVENVALKLKASGDKQSQGIANRLNALLEFQGEMGAAGRATTRKAMEWAKSRENARLRYFKPGGEPVTVPGAAGVRVYVLGPPRDPKLIRKSDPSTRSSEVYELTGAGGSNLGFLAAVEDLAATGTGGNPFDPWFTISEADAWGDDFFGEHYGFDVDGEGVGEVLAWRRIENDWLGAASPLALRLDSHTNNTSLALAFELEPSRRVFLFPGDAQVGNWMSWADLRWRIKDGADVRDVSTHDLLARTVLYKVGHHGSHNATLRDQGLELMTSPELTAMLPVDRETAKKMEWVMPFPTLYRRLQLSTAGRIIDLETGIPDMPPEGSTAHEWETFKKRCDVQPDWVDFHIEW